jgi:hypothetical protein
MDTFDGCFLDDAVALTLSMAMLMPQLNLASAAVPKR